MEAAISAIVPVIGCSNSQPQITAPEAGNTAAATSPTNRPPPLAAWVENSSSCTATRVVLLAGRMPLNWAMRKNSCRPRCTITPTATVNHQPPSITTTKPKPPAAQPLSSRAAEVALRRGGLAAAGGPGGGGGCCSGECCCWGIKGARQRSGRGVRPPPTSPGCPGAACGAPSPAPPARRWPPAGRGCRWHPPSPPGWWC